MLSGVLSPNWRIQAFETCNRLEIQGVIGEVVRGLPRAVRENQPRFSRPWTLKNSE